MVASEARRRQSEDVLGYLRPTLEVVKPEEPRLVTEPIPPWEEDGYLDEWGDEETARKKYEEDQVALVEGLFEESKEYYEKQKARWVRADKLVDLEHILDTLLDRHPEKTRLPYLPQAIEEWLSVRHANVLRPSAGSRQSAFDQVVAAGNYIMEQELDANRYNLLRLRVGLDQLKFRIGFIRTSVDTASIGIFGQKGEHRLDRVDPRYVWPDRYATSWEWRDMKYMVIATPMDISDVRRMWPDKGFLVRPDSHSWAGVEDEKGKERGTLIMRSAAKKGEYQIGQRERVLVLECYLKDGRKRRIPAGYDESGSPRTDAKGRIQSRYVDRYPKGRLLISANGVLLRDTENPFDHGEPPLQAFPEGITDGLFSYSPLELLDLVDRKINLLVKEAYQNLRCHMNSPWIVDRNAFTKPSQYDEISQNPKAVYIVRPNSRIARLPPGELPQIFLPFIEYLKDVFDQVLGVTKIDRGQLEKGSQMSAQSVIQLQGASGQRQVMKKDIDKECVRGLGHKMFWNIRQYSPQKMTIKAKDPVSGEDKVYEWNRAELDGNMWDVKIDAGDAQGAEASAQQRAMNFYDRGAIDHEELLRVANWPQSGKVIQRMKEERTRLAELGFVKEALQHGVISRAMSQRGPKKQSGMV